MSGLKTLAVTAALMAASVGAAQAAVVTYIGADNNVNSVALMPNSNAAAAAFDAAAMLNVIDFESALPGGISLSGGSTTSVSGCGALCGFNTTVGGANFRLLSGGSLTVSFASAVDSFGFYVTGLQTNFVGQQTVTFFDGSTQTINFPAAVQGGLGGGGAFIGFTDVGAAIASISINVSNDIVAIDDIRFGKAGAAVPEPGTLALGGLGLIALGAIRRRRRV